MIDITEGLILTEGTMPTGKKRTKNRSCKKRVTIIKGKEKKCSMCNHVLLIHKFVDDNGTEYSLCTECREKGRLQRRKYVEAHRDQINAYKKEYRARKKREGVETE